MEVTLFSEKQYFRGRHAIPFYVLLIALTGLFVYGIFQQILLKKPFGDKPASDVLLIAGAMMPVALLVLLYSCSLETKLTSKGVYYRWVPFRRKYRFVDWSDLIKAEMLNYGFVGYGWRLSTHGTIYTLGGKTGLHLEKKSGSRLTLGTRQPEAIQQVLTHLKSDGSLSGH